MLILSTLAGVKYKYLCYLSDAKEKVWDFYWKLAMNKFGVEVLEKFDQKKRKKRKKTDK